MALTPEALAFETPDLLWRWLEQHHADQPELWVRVFKKASGTPSVTWDDLVVVALTWGWIDGQRRALDDVSFLQRLTPRRRQSLWSARNCAIAERLIQEGLMQTPGLAQVQAARADGRWDRAYAGGAAMVLPADFLAEVQRVPAAWLVLEALNRTHRYTIYHRLHTARTPEIRLRRMKTIIAQLAGGDFPSRKKQS